MKRKLLTGLLVSALAASFAVPTHAQTYGAAYVTAITYQNLSSSTANITFSFYNEANGTATNFNYTLAANAAGSLNVGSTSLAAGFKGSTVMSSDQPVAATLVQLPPQANASKTRPLSNGFSSGSSTVLIATALKSYFNTTSILSVQNTDSVDNNFSVSFYRIGTTSAEVVTTTVSVPPGAAKYYDLGQINFSQADFNGSAVVVATKTSGGAPGSAVATVMELSTNAKAASAFEGAASGGTTVYMPSAMCQYSGAVNNSNFAVQNTSNSTTATVTTTFNPGGIVYTIQIGPYGKASINACTAGNPVGWLGAATITASQPIIAIGKISGGGLSTAFLGATSGVSKVALPYVRWANQTNYDNGTKQRTFITIQNVGTTTTTNPINVKYYDVNGNLVGTHSITSTLGPGAKANSNPSLVTLDVNGEFGYSPSTGGSVIVESTGAQLAVVVRASSKIANTTELAGEDYNGIPVSP